MSVRAPVCTENLIRVDAVMESPKLAEGCFLGGSLGCDGAVGFERRGVGGDGAADHRST